MGGYRASVLATDGAHIVLGGWDSIAGECITATERAIPVKAEGLADDVGAVLSFVRWFCLSF